MIRWHIERAAKVRVMGYVQCKLNAMYNANICRLQKKTLKITQHAEISAVVQSGKLQNQWKRPS